MRTTTWIVLAMALLVVAAPTQSDAEPLCKAMCQRFSDCKVSSDTTKCLDYCKQHGYEDSEQGRAQLAAFARASCPQIQQVASAVRSAVDQRRRAASPRRGADAPARGATSQPQAVTGCSSACGRVSKCGLMSLPRCNDLCARAAADGHRWRMDQASCSEIKKAFVTDKWLCTSQVSMGTRLGNGAWHYSTVSATGTGTTRDDAGFESHKNCSAILTTKLSLAESEGEVVDAGMCTVSQCVPPGTPAW